MLRCPFHEDKTPSMQVYEKTNTVYCFSTNCQTHGKKLDVIDFILHKEGGTKHTAILKAKEILGSVAPTGKPRASVGKETSSQDDLLAQFYKFKTALSKNKLANQYLKSRHLDKTKLELGYNPQNSKYPHLKNCIIFPLKNKTGEIVSFYGRSVAPTGKPSTAGKHFYLSGRKGLYPEYPRSTTETLILTEAIIDAATLQSHLILDTHYSVLSLYGTNGWTQEHLHSLQSCPDLKEVIFFMDGDASGKAAVEKYSKELKSMSMGKQLAFSFVETPENEDINSLLDSHEPQILDHLINERKQLAETEKGKSQEPKANSYQLDTTNPELLHYSTPELHIQILGGIKMSGLDRLRVTLKITSVAKSFLFPIRHSLDLYHHKHTQELAENISNQLEVTLEKAKQHLNMLTGSLEEYRESRLEALKTPKKKKKELTDYQRQEALNYLKDPNLLQNTAADIALSGMIGEKVNSLIALLVYTSRKREKPLQLMCLGSSGSGKTHLQEKISACIPEEEKIEITMLSENAFYYFGKQELKGKLILIEDLDGAQEVLYPLRELQSKRKISKTVTLKDSKGNLKTQTLEVEGPVCVSGCTTREKLYEDNANRCLLLYIDQSTVQDKKIMDYQKQSSAGKINHHAEQDAQNLLQNAQRLLQPIRVVNPYAQYIDLPESVFKPRRSMYLLLSFIETITFYHQLQRRRIISVDGEPYIESTVQDVEMGFELLKETLFRKSDELNGACRNFLERLKKYLQSEKAVSFKTQEIRKELRMNPNNLKRYVRELLQYNYLKVLGGNRYKGYEYQLEDILEYDTLRNNIDEQINDILLKINELSGSVGHSGSKQEMTHSNNC